VGHDFLPLLNAAKTILKIAGWRSPTGVPANRLETERPVTNVFHKAFALQKDGDLAAAEKAYRSVLENNPSHLPSLNNLAAILRRKGRLEAARSLFEQALINHPENADLCLNLGNLLAELGDAEAAFTQFRRAAGIAPDNAAAWFGLTAASLRRNLPEEALAAGKRGLALDPNHAAAWNNLGVALKELGRFDEALDAYERALAVDPDDGEIRYNRGVVHLLRGDYRQGWPDYEYRFAGPAGRPPGGTLGRPKWSGQGLAGKAILLIAEQGLGDAIQFIRFAPALKDRGAAAVFVQCREPLARLLKNAPGVDRVLVPGAPVPTIDYFLPLLSLPGLLGMIGTTIPAADGYLPAPAAAANALPDKGAFNIGLNWTGSPTNEADAKRSIPLDSLAPLAGIPSCRLFSLQFRAGREPLEAAGLADYVTDLGDRLGDFAQTAALVGELDLIVTVDTALAHLAGAMGRPAWVLLAHVPDWRWTMEGETTPWYDSLTLFRQPATGRPQSTGCAAGSRTYAP